MTLSGLIRRAGDLGGYALARKLTAGRPRILMYHRFSAGPQPGHVSADAFERQVRYISRFYNPVTVSQIALGVHEQGSLPGNSIAITIDDGYEDFYSIAWPILKKYKVPATFYVTTGFVNGDLWLWPDQLRFLLERSPDSENTFDFGLVKVQTPIRPEDFENVFWHINSTLLTADNREKLRCLSEMALAWRVGLPDAAPAEYQAVSWDQLDEMQREGLEVGGHTVTHPSLARVSLDDAHREIIGCQQALQQHLGVNARSFCYPNGTPDDFVSEQVNLVREAGFTCATVAFADSREHAQRYAMRRHSGSADQFQFLKAVSGVELLGMKWRKVVRETPYA